MFTIARPYARVFCSGEQPVAVVVPFESPSPASISRLVGLVTAEEFDRIVDPKDMIGPK